MKKILLELFIIHCSLLIAPAQTGRVQQNSGALSNLRSVFFIDVNRGYAVGDTACVKTTDSGLNWTRFYPGSGFNSVFFLDANSGFVCGINYPYAFASRTTNGGTNWNLIYNGASNSRMYSIWFDNNTTGIIAGSFFSVKVPFPYVFRTTNAGSNWSTYLPVGLGNMTSVYFVDSFTGYVCGDGGQIVKTTNSGSNWIDQGISGNPSLYSIYFMNGTTGWTVGNNNVYKTTSGGNNWFSLFNQGGYAVRFVNEQTGWICGSSGTIYGTINGGVNWTLQSSGTTPNLRSLSFVNAQTGWGVGDLGRILKTTTGGFTFIEPTSNEIPEQFSLFQNYPNPFNPGTKLKFQIAKLSDASLTLYDVLGREVITLVNQKLKPGMYEVEFDGTNYPSGVYFYKLEAGEFSEAKKMVLIK